MPFAITQSCCSDASCVAVCPVDCIHPTPDEPDFGRTEMLYVDPRSCIDCGACADACPVDAIFPVESLKPAQREYAAVNADYFVDRPTTGAEGPWDAPVFPASLSPAASGLRVVVVGTGPSAGYTASALLTTSAEVTMIDRLRTPGGLVRFGVAPDHLSTKAIGERFATVRANPRLRLHLGVEVGAGPGRLSHDDLLAHHDAVVYAVGASADRRLDVPGEDLPGVLAARTFVGWYNGHPEIAADAVDLSGASAGSAASGTSGARRLVVIGNGNVALDVARMTLGDPARLAGTDAAPHAVGALGASSITEVVLVARRGPQDAAYSLSELRALLADPDLEVVVEAPDADAVSAAIEGAPAGSKAAALRGLPVRDSAGEQVPPPGPGERRRLVLRFHTVVDAIVGEGRVSGIDLRAAAVDGAVTHLPTGLVLRSVGYRSEPIPGLPFDKATATVPHDAGRVIDPTTGVPVPATYVVGWIKRGPRGGIGSNRADAAETVASIVADANAGRLTVGRGSHRSFARLLR